jgi:hypothetical protein
MAKKLTHTEAFAHFGTIPTNVQWSWSARNEETKIVVCTLWQDEFSRRGGRLVYERSKGGAWELSRKSPGFDEMKENLAWAQDNCEGRVHIIIAIPKDKTTFPHSIGECFPSKIVMNVTRLDRETGEFILEAEDGHRSSPP